MLLTAQQGSHLAHLTCSWTHWVYKSPEPSPGSGCLFHLLPAPCMKAAAGSLPPATTTGFHPEIWWETEVWARIKTSMGLRKGIEMQLKKDWHIHVLMSNCAFCPIDFQSSDFLGPVLGPSMCQPASYTRQSSSLTLKWHCLGSACLCHRLHA